MELALRFFTSLWWLNALRRALGFLMPDARDSIERQAGRGNMKLTPNTLPSSFAILGGNTLVIWIPGATLGWLGEEYFII